MQKFLIILVALATSIATQAQTIKGRALDLNEEKGLPRATVLVVDQKDTNFKKEVIADTTGRFTFSNLPLRTYELTVKYIGYLPYKQTVTLSSSNPNATLGDLLLLKSNDELEEVTVKTKTPPVSQKGDTLQLSADQFKVNPDATVEDLIKKMPGFTVGRDGTVTTGGEQVRKVTIDGKDFFGDDASAALRNLPSSVVDKIQVFDRLSDQAQMTGFDDGNSVKAINIVTRSGMNNGQFGRVYAGYGTDDTYQAGGNMSFFKNNRRISVVGNFNNINQQNFGAQDLLGVTSSGGGRGGMGGGGGMGGFGGGGNNFQVAQDNGISTTNAFGVNYNDKWGKKVNVSGSYFFNQSKNINNSESTSDYFNLKQISNNNSYSQAKNYNHRINMRIEYNIDSLNTLQIIPSVNFQNNESISNTSANRIGSELMDSLSRQSGLRDVTRKGYNIRNNIMFRHSFKNNRRRSYSIGFNQTFNQNNGETYSNSAYRFFDKFGGYTDSLLNQFIDNPTDGLTLNGNINYVEPIGDKSQLQFSYRPSWSKNSADQRTYNYDPIAAKYSDFVDSLSNTFENINTTHNAGVTFRKNISRDKNFSIGVEFQQTRLESERIFPNAYNVDQKFSTILPNAMLNTAFSPRSKLRVFYRTSTRFPSVNQLQNVLDQSNITNLSMGNPNLKQSYNHFLSARYTFTNTQLGQSFIANVFANAQQDYISNAVYSPTNGEDHIIVDGIRVERGSQFTKPVNLNGYKSFNSFLTFSQTINAIKSNINISGGFNYLSTPSLNNNQLYKTENFTYTASVNLGSNVSEYVDFNIGYNFNYSDPKSNSPRASTSSYIKQDVSVQMNLLSKNGWFFQNDLWGESYSGLSGNSFNQSFWRWNAAVGKKIFKDRSGELKLSVFDLLKQNQSISRQIQETYIQDSKSVVLQQYFMLTFTYSLKNFGKAPERNNNRGGQGNWTPGAPGGPGGGGMPPMMMMP